MNKKVFPSTAKKVQEQTNPCINNEIRNCAMNRITTYKDSTPEMLSEKINDLNNEWDIERFLEVNTAVTVLLCSLLGVRRSKLFLFTGVLGFFLLQHALQGCCPLLTLVRSMGLRTAEEIYNEKTALKIARNDFAQKPSTASELLTLAEK